MPNVIEDNKQQTPEVQQANKQPEGLLSRTWGVAADVTAWRLRMDDEFDRLLNENEDDPAKKTCSGCPPENKKTNWDIYEDQMQQVAKENNLDLSNHKQKREAHMHVVDYMRPKLRENRRYEKQDRDGPPVAEGPEFTVKDGRIYYPKYGASLQQLYENQKRVYPKQYDPKQHATMTLMEQAFVNGATRVSHVSHNKDEKGNEAIRDQITMVLDPETGKGRMEIRNIATDGNFLSTQEAYDVMKKNNDSLVEGHPADGVFIFTDVPMESKQVHEILSAVDDEQVASHEYQSEITQTPQYTMIEFSEWMDTSTIDTRDPQKFVGVPVFLQKLLGNLLEHQDTTQNRPIGENMLMSLITEEKKISALEILTTEPTIDAEKGEDLVIVWKQIAQKTLEITEDQADRLVSQIEKTRIDMGEKKILLIAISETGLGVGAGIAILEALVLLEMSSSYIDPLERIAMPEGADNIPVETVEREILVADELSAEDVVFIWFSSFMEKIKDMEPEEAMTPVVKEEEKTLESVTTLWIVLLSLAQKDRPRNGNDMSIRAPQEEMSLEEKETVEHFQLAVVVWFLLKLTSYHDGLIALRNRLVEQTKNIMKSIPEKKDSVSTDEAKQHIPEALIQQEATQWTLFAIIWYLAMIREQGNAQSQPQNAKTVKQKRTKIYSLVNSHFPDYGVIFAFQ